MSMIYCANPKAQYLPYKKEIDTAIQHVLDSGTYILGEQVSLFEQEFAEYLGASFAVGCGSGTDALVLALKALDIGMGDEVIVPSFTATPTVAAIVMAGATPVYVDIEPDFYTIDPVCVEAACTEKTKAIIVVHLYGQSAAMDELMVIAKQHGLRVIEDCAQATGASYHDKKLGTIGDIGCFSFFPTKNLGALGDGGALVCHDESLAVRLRSLRQYGWNKHRISQEPGINSRLDEVQAAILRVKLKHLDSCNKERQQLAFYYNELLLSLPIKSPLTREFSSHVFHLYVVKTKHRDALIQALKENNVFLSIHYPIPVNRMRAFLSKKDLPVTDDVINHIATLPLFPRITSLTQNLVAQLIENFYK